MNYPNGVRPNKHKKTTTQQSHTDYRNRGMTLEEDIHMTNQYYVDINRAIIHKKPTPIQIVRVNYPRRSAAVITEGYFKQASTTDFNGVYKQKHIDFEAKETKNKTSFPLANIHDHQIKHMLSVKEHGGICFLIIRFTLHHETYVVPIEKIISYWKQQLDGGRKSIPYENIKQYGYLVPFKYQARVDYLEVIDNLYF